MYRFFEEELHRWKAQNKPIPLLFRGARQVGKSYSIEKFARANFENSVTINFEMEPHYANCFKNLNPKNILEEIAIRKSQNIIARKSLLFLDEVQSCPQAIVALRYFYEEMPGLHVIAAGSLLDFSMQSGQISIPVGRVQYVFVQPLSFYEFLMASGNQGFLSWIKNLSLNVHTTTNIHNELIDKVKKYFIFGGMPNVLNKYLIENDVVGAISMQSSIVNAYREDFGKYAKLAQHKYLNSVFYSIPHMLGQKVKFSKIDPDFKSRDLKDALELLIKAGIITKVKRTSGAGLPLGAESSEKHFKSIFLDIGLAQNILGIDQGVINQVMNARDFDSIAAGALAEQFVGQELLAHKSYYQERELYFWENTAAGSSAELDFLVSYAGKVFPVEVKSGATGRLKSLGSFMDKYKPPFGIKISQEELNFNGKILSIPLYAISEIHKLMEEALDNNPEDNK